MKVRWIARLMLCTMVLFVISLAGCREEKSDQDVVQKENKGNDENVLALIGDQEVTVADVEAMLEGIPARRQEMLKNRVLDDVIELKVFAMEARAKGLHRDPEIQAAMEKERKEVLARKFISMYVDKEAMPSEEVLKQYYDGHREEFLMPESVLVRQIVARDQDRAEAVLKALKEGASFEALAKKESINYTKRGLELETRVYRGRGDKAFEKAVFSLEEGAFSGVIKTKKGYQVCQVVEKKKPRHFTYEEARQKIASKLFWENKRDIIKRYHEAAGVDTNPDAPNVLAKVGEETFKEESLAHILSRAPKKEHQKLKERWTEYFIETTVFSKEAEKINLDKDPEVIKKLTLKKDRLLAKALRAKYFKRPENVSDADIKEYYENNQQAFLMPEKVRLKSILVKTEEEAINVLVEIVEEGKPFGLVAQQKSLHPLAKERAGEIGWFAKGQLEPAMEKVAFSLEKGEMSSVIETKNGFEIIKVMDKKGGHAQPLEDVAQAIKMNIMMKNFEEQKKQIYANAGVKILRPYQ